MKFRLTGKFGELSPVRDFQPHSGIDLAMPEGTTLRAITEGTIRLADYGSENAGKTVLIDSNDGHTYIYGHLHDFAVKNGSHVRAGDIIGHSGHSGNSFGNHLHFGVKDSATGHLVDPTSIADKVADLSGDHVSPGIITALFNNESTQGPLTRLFWKSTSGIREHAADVATEIALGILDSLKDLLLGVSLIGSALCIILKVAGWKDGGRWAGILIVANVLIKYLLGGL